MWCCFVMFEGVDLGVVLGDVGQCVVVFVIDWILLIVVMIVMILIVVFGVWGVGEKLVELVVIIWLLGLFLICNFYFIVMEMCLCVVIFGKCWMGLCVVVCDGGWLIGDVVIVCNLL